MIKPEDLPKTRRETLEWWATLEVDVQSGRTPYTWKEIDRELGLCDLFYLLTRLLRRSDADRDWLFDRCREVQISPNGYLDLWSRDHYKSTIITFALAIQNLLNDPELTIGILSHTRPVAKGFLQQIKREFEENAILKDRYSDVLWANPERESPKWSEDAGLIIKRKTNPKESSIEAHGLVDGMPTGRHFSVLIYDDVVVPASVTSGEMIEKTTNAWDISQNLGTADGVIRVIGTRYHLADTYSTMMQRGTVKPRIHAATHNGRMDGVPVFWTQEQWQRKLRDSSRQIVAAQQLLNPLADEVASFRPEWLRAYEIRPRTLSVYIMGDPSRGRSATSDATAIAVVGISSNGSKFLLDGFCHRMSLSARWIALRTMYHKWSRMSGINRVQVGYERYGLQSDVEYFEERMQADRRDGVANAVFAITELNWPREGGHSKRERVERLEPDFRNSRFYLPAVVLREGKVCLWDVQDDPELRNYGEISYEPMRGPTKRQAEALRGGSPDLIVKPIRKTDEDRALYDLTARFLQEYVQFPAGAHDDLLDAVSRFIDLEPTRPINVNRYDTEPHAYWDR